MTDLPRSDDVAFATDYLDDLQTVIGGLDPGSIDESDHPDIRRL